MTINGNVKFFKKNVINSSTTFTLTSAPSGNSDHLYDNNQSTFLTSSGSSDGVPEVWDFEFSSSKYFDRVYIDGHNFETGTLQYWNGSTYTDFSTPIAWSSSTDTTNYYEFTGVTTTKVRLSVTDTQDSGEKKASQIRFFEEVGTVSANPSIWDFEFDEYSIKHRTANAGNVYVFFDSKYIAALTFSDATDADVIIFQTLKTLSEPFYIYPCGGVTTHTQIGFRVNDMYYANYVNNFKPSLKNNMLGIGTVISLDIREV